MTKRFLKEQGDTRKLMGERRETQKTLGTINTVKQKGTRRGKNMLRNMSAQHACDTSYIREVIGSKLN